MMSFMSFMKTGMKWTAEVKVKAYLYGTCSTLTTEFERSLILVT